MLCADGPVKTLVELSLAAEHRRGHGALYAALGRGRPEPTRLRRARVAGRAWHSSRGAGATGPRLVGGESMGCPVVGEGTRTVLVPPAA